MNVHLIQGQCRISERALSSIRAARIPAPTAPDSAGYDWRIARFRGAQADASLWQSNHRLQGEKGGGSSADDFPAYGTGLTAAKAGHHTVHITCYRSDGPGSGASVQTVCLVWLNDAGDGTVFAKSCGKASKHSPGEASDARLKEKMGGHLQIIFFELTEDFLGDGSIIPAMIHAGISSYPGHAVSWTRIQPFCFAILVSQTDGAIVILVCDLGVGALSADVFQALQRAALWHIDHRLVA